MNALHYFQIKVKKDVDDEKEKESKKSPYEIKETNGKVNMAYTTDEAGLKPVFALPNSGHLTNGHTNYDFTKLWWHKRTIVEPTGLELMYGGRDWRSLYNADIHSMTMLGIVIPTAPNLCTEAVIDRVMITRMLAHWMKPRYNKSAILLPAFGRSIRVIHNAYS